MERPVGYSERIAARTEAGASIVNMEAPRDGASTEPGRRGVRLAYLPGLDGLRALAVIAVVLYHAGLPLRGGFLGVEIFFVLSGFLITALLRTEWQAHSRIDLAAFWLRRARRLLPALFVLLGGTLVLQAVLLRDGLAALGDDVAAALGYVMNWHLIWSQQSYFDPLVRPPLLQHLWSLAVEEQFYLVWPVLFALGMRFLRDRGLLLVIMASAIGSAALMATLFEPGADPSRIYYGTDTRASGLLVGAALALRWTPGVSWPAGRRRSSVPDMLGVLALAGLGAAVVGLPETHPLLYRGGFVVVALGTAAAIAAVTHNQSQFMPRLLGFFPLVWIGQRSYSIYLWHWPIFLLTRPRLDVPLDGWPLLVVRLLLVVGLAALSYRFVEQPIRQGALERLWRVRRARRVAQANAASRGMLGRRWLSLALVVLVVANIGTYAPEHSTPITAAAIQAAAARTSGAASPAGKAEVPSALPDRPEGPWATAVVAGTPSAPTPTPSAAALPAAPSVPAAIPEPVAASPAAEPSAAASPAVADTPAPASTALSALDNALAAELQQLLEVTVADGSAPGAVLAVSVPGYATWTGASGVADVATQAPMEPTTQIRIASSSKLFTAVVVLQLVEEGQLALDAPIATYLPDLLPAGDTITVRQLLNHTSGLYDYLEDRDLIAEAYRDPEHAWTPDELVAYAARFPLSFRPGARGAWNYSSTNYVILGMLVEQRTGNPLAVEFRRRILDPLGLAQTVFTPDEPIPGVLAHGYSDNVDLSDAPMTVAFGTASIVSTAGDLQRFAEALFTGALLKPESLAEMEQFVDGRGQYGMPELAYGLGVMRNRLPVGPAPDGSARPAAASTVLGHIGGFGGFRSAVWYVPESGITIALGFNQAAADPNRLASRVLQAILTAQGR